MRVFLAVAIRIIACTVFPYKASATVPSSAPSTQYRQPCIWSHRTWQSSVLCWSTTFLESFPRYGLLLHNAIGVFALTDRSKRIFAALLNKGRSSISQLTQYTSLTPRQLRHGLVVLLQNNLLYFQTESGHAIYTANADAAYNLVRTGKVLDMVGSVYGEAAVEVMQNLLSMGHTKVEHLRDAYEAKFKQAARVAAAANGIASGDVNGSAAHDQDSDEARPDTKTGPHIKSLQELDEVLCRMIQAELVVTVTKESFRSWEDTRKLIEDEVHAAYFAGGVRGAKGKEEFASRLGKRLREVRDDPINIKRKLQAKLQMNKRRKLSEWNSANTGDDFDDDELIVDVSHFACPNIERAKADIRERPTLSCVSITKNAALNYGTSNWSISLMRCTVQLPPRCMPRSCSN